MKTSITILTTSIFALTLFCTPLTSSAESVVWTKTYNQDLYSRLTRGYYTSIRKPSVQIKYGASVRNTDTGELYSCGDNVPRGSQLTFEYEPHDYRDVFWFGTGFAFDSPFGDWVRDAKRGAGGMCIEKNYFFTESGPSYPNATKHYSNLSVNPPAKTITGLIEEDCVTVEGSNKTCTFDEVGEVNATFVFGETYGKFHNGWTHKIVDRAICKIFPDALYQMNDGITGKIVMFYPSASQFKHRGNSVVSEYVRATHPTSIFTVDIPEQTISCPITIIDPEGNPPSAPIITTIGGDRSCQTGVPATYTFTATDTDGSPETSSIRYVIDWDNDGSADQMLPVAGYVASGTSLSTAHIWRTPGAKTFRAKAQDKQGLSSAWATFTTDPCTGDVIEDDLFDIDTYGTYPDGKVTFAIEDGLTNDTCTASWDAQYVTSCSILRNGVLYREGVNSSGDEEVDPGVYQMTCTQLKDGAVLSEKQSCVKNPGFREI